MTGAPGRAKIRKGVSLGHAFWQIGSLTAVSRVVGFIRDIAFASFLGAGPAADAFLVALKLPNMFRRLTAEGAMTNAFLPSFAKLRTAEGRQAALGLAAEAQIILILVLFGIVFLAEIFMPQILLLLAPGFAATPDRLAAAVDEDGIDADGLEKDDVAHELADEIGILHRAATDLDEKGLAAE